MAILEFHNIVWQHYSDQVGEFIIF